MRGWVWGMCVALGLAAAPAFAHKEKRTDPCGCHHQWGLRHCHPKKKTVRCEAPASASGTVEQDKVDRQPGKPKPTWRSEHTADL